MARSLSKSLVPAVASAALLAPTLASAKFVFPYNHPDLDWYTIETDHFYVHYPVSKKQEGNPHYINPEFSARKMAKVADEMYDPMCAEFGHYLTEKVHIVLLDQSDYLEGFTIPSWDWIEISANKGGYFYRMRGNMEWFSDVLVHEYAHVVSLKKNAPFAEGMQGILLGGLFTDPINDALSAGEIFIGDTDPFWWTEGGAEYWSDNTGYNWWTTSRDTNLRTTVLEDRLLTYDEWITRVEKRDWGDGERGYQGGYSFALYLRERFGDDTYARFAQTSDEGWRLNWETIVEDVTGLHLRQLYDDWKAYLESKYGAEFAGVRAAGEAVGNELEMSSTPWVFTSPDDHDEWLFKQGKESWHLRRLDRENERENTGTWEGWPKVSPDGRYVAEHNRGLLTLAPIDETSLVSLRGSEPRIAGWQGDAALADSRAMSEDMWAFPMEFMHGYDFVPGTNQLVTTVNSNDRKGWAHLETKGYDFKQLAVVTLETESGKRKHRGAKESFEEPPHDWKDLKKRYEPIPNTLRGQDPAVSPDGQRVAYFEYRDGTLNLVLIDIDGSNKTYVTDYRDGTWLNNVDWSPDGSQLVFSVFKGYRQDLYLVNADGTDMRAIMRDRWEDQDAHWADDGNIYFSSDPDGIFNIYRYEPETERIVQLTNVIGAAYMPWLTPDGNLLYMNWTGHGWKNFALSRYEFVEQDVTEKFGLDFDEEEVQRYLAYEEDLSEWESRTTRYKWTKSFMAPTLVPMFRIENDSRTNLGLSGGLQVFFQDLAEKHGMVLMTQLGEDPLFMAQYFNQMTHGDIFATAYHYQAKFDYAFLIDDDDDPTTTNDQSIFDGKQHQYVNVAALGYSYPWNRQISTYLTANAVEFGFRGIADRQFEPYIRSMGANAGFAYNGVRGAYSGAPTGGRAVNFDWSLTHTDIVYAPQNGKDSDDGQLFDEYLYNRFELNWTENLPAPTFWGLFPGVRKRRHTLQLSANVGVIDRNVQFQDEFRGGGTHPYFVGSGNIQPNNQFAGFPAFSLSGETMVVMAAAYRFPIVQQLNKKMGPWYLYDITMQIGGTAGNFWSYRPPEESDVGSYYTDGFGNRIAYDPADVRREIPFIDSAYKNGNWMLFDTSAELRINSTWGGMPWNTFFRMAWGLNEITGVADVNNDDIQDTTTTSVGTAVSNESELPGPRFYIGVGTGW